MVPWRSGRLLVWGATCPDTYAPTKVLVKKDSASFLLKVYKNFITLSRNFVKTSGGSHGTPFSAV